jgi:hypothetical protein
MAARIVHFGADNVGRCFALACCGYSVTPCGTSVPRLYHELKKEQIDAVTLGEDGLRFARRVLSISHSSSVPLIVFAANNRHSEGSKFDLVIPAGIPTTEWLPRVAEVVQRSRSIREESKRISEQCTELRLQAVRLRKKAILECVGMQSLQELLDLRRKIFNLHFALQNANVSDKQRSILLLALTEANNKLNKMFPTKSE